MAGNPFANLMGRSLDMGNSLDFGGGGGGGGGDFMNAAAGIGFMANPLVGLGIAGIGAFTNYLGAKKQEQFFEEMQGKIEYAMSPGAFRKRFSGNLRQQSGNFAGALRGARASGESAAAGVQGSFARAGLSGVGAGVGAGVKAGVGLQAQRARDVYKMEIAKFSQHQQDQQVQAYQQLLQSPYGAVDPMSATLAGAGTGLEAWTNAKWAEQMSGRRA